MRIRRVTGVLAGLAIMAMFAAPARAQPSAAAGASDAEPTGDIGLTFNILRYEGETAKTGFGFDASRTVGRLGTGVGLQIAGDLSASYFSGSSDASYVYSGTTQTSFMGGIRLVGRGQPKAKARLFAQALAGAVHCCGETDAAMMFGGGVDVPIGGKRLNLRLQADVPAVFYKAGVDDDGVAYAAGRDVGFRFNVGLAIALGGR